MRKTALLVLALIAGTAGLGGAAPGAAAQPPAGIVDSLGRKVRPPEKVARLISLSPEATRVVIALGAGDRLVGIDHFLRRFDHVFPLLFPAGRGLPVVSNQGQDLNYEVALRLRPDLVIASPSEFRAADAIERKMKVPVAALASMGRFDGLVAEIETLGRLLGRPERAAWLVSYIRSGMAGAGSPGAGLAGRPSVYLSFWGSLARTPVSYDPVEAAGGRNVAAGLLPDHLGTTAATVSLEQLLVWDPEIILVHGNYPPDERLVTVEGVLRDPRLASLRAVRTGRVHYTFGFWYWWDPALVLVETVYLARLFRPGPAETEDLTTTGDRIFKDVYGIDGAFSALCRVIGCHAWDTK